MTRFKIVGMVVMLALWLPATNHCRLEQLPGFSFLTCCEHEEAPASHRDDDCQTDGCAVVESGFYKTASGRIQSPKPVLLTATLLSLVSDEIPAPPASRPTLSTSVPPDDSGGWQFFFRTALPPRAPSLAS